MSKDRRHNEGGPQLADMLRRDEAKRADLADRLAPSCRGTGQRNAPWSNTTHSCVIPDDFNVLSRPPWEGESYADDGSRALSAPKLDESEDT